MRDHELRVEPETVIGGKEKNQTKPKPNARLRLMGAEGCRKGLSGALVALFPGRGFTQPHISQTPRKPHVIA